MEMIPPRSILPRVMRDVETAYQELASGDGYGEIEIELDSIESWNAALLREVSRPPVPQVDPDLIDHIRRSDPIPVDPSLSGHLCGEPTNWWDEKDRLRFLLPEREICSHGIRQMKLSTLRIMKDEWSRLVVPDGIDDVIGCFQDFTLYLSCDIEYDGTYILYARLRNGKHKQCGPYKSLKRCQDAMLSYLVKCGVVEVLL